MKPDSDLSTRGLGRLEGEFLKSLDLRDVTLVGNESYAEQGAAIARLKGKDTRTGGPVTNHQGTCVGLPEHHDLQSGIDMMDHRRTVVVFAHGMWSW